MKQLLTVTALLLLFTTCTKKDDCPTCENGGTCVGGECDCPPAWTGEKCQIEKMPSSMIIHAVKVLSWPQADQAGAGWDVFDGPDIKLVILDGVQNLYQSPNFYEDAIPGQNIIFYPELSLFFPGRPLTMRIYDYDNGLTTDDFMGGIEGKMYREGQRFPEKFTMQCAGCTVSVEVEVSYYF